MPSPIRRLRTALTAQSDLGLAVVPRRWLSLAEAAARRANNPPPVVPVVATPAPGSGGTPPADGGDQPDAPTLDELAKIAAGCTRCGLAGSRTQVVFGTGDPEARLMIIGEAPGADEDREGEPFVGRAGKLLTDILAAVGLTRDAVYIANVLKCRPPGNRNPEAEEIAACRPILDRQIALIRPEVILTLGTFASQTVLRSGLAISELRGRFHDLDSTPVFPTYHPAYLFHNPRAKRPVWEDVKQVARRLGLPEPFPGERGS